MSAVFPLDPNNSVFLMHALLEDVAEENSVGNTFVKVKQEMMSLFEYLGLDVDAVMKICTGYEIYGKKTVGIPVFSNGHMSAIVVKGDDTNAKIYIINTGDGVEFLGVFTEDNRRWGKILSKDVVVNSNQYTNFMGFISQNVPGTSPRIHELYYFIYGFLMFDRGDDYFNYFGGQEKKTFAYGFDDTLRVELQKIGNCSFYSMMYMYIFISAKVEVTNDYLIKEIFALKKKLFDYVFKNELSHLSFEAYKTAYLIMMYKAGAKSEYDFDTMERKYVDCFINSYENNILFSLGKQMYIPYKKIDKTMNDETNKTYHTFPQDLYSNFDEANIVLKLKILDVWDDELVMIFNEMIKGEAETLRKKANDILEKTVSFPRINRDFMEKVSQVLKSQINFDKIDELTEKNKEFNILHRSEDVCTGQEFNAFHASKLLSDLTDTRTIALFFYKLEKHLTEIAFVDEVEKNPSEKIMILDGKSYSESYTIENFGEKIKNFVWYKFHFEFNKQEYVVKESSDSDNKKCYIITTHDNFKKSNQVYENFNKIIVEYVAIVDALNSLTVDDKHNIVKEFNKIDISLDFRVCNYVVDAMNNAKFYKINSNPNFDSHEIIKRCVSVDAILDNIMRYINELPSQCVLHLLFVFDGIYPQNKKIKLIIEAIGYNKKIFFKDNESFENYFIKNAIMLIIIGGDDEMFIETLCFFKDNVINKKYEIVREIFIKKIEKNKFIQLYNISAARQIKPVKNNGFIHISYLINGVEQNENIKNVTLIEFYRNTIQYNANKIEHGMIVNSGDTVDINIKKSEIIFVERHDFLPIKIMKNFKFNGNVGESDKYFFKLEINKGGNFVRSDGYKLVYLNDQTVHDSVCKMFNDDPIYFMKDNTVEILLDNVIIKCIGDEVYVNDNRLIKNLNPENLKWVIYNDNMFISENNNAVNILMVYTPEFNDKFNPIMKPFFGGKNYEIHSVTEKVMVIGLCYHFQGFSNFDRESFIYYFKKSCECNNYKNASFLCKIFSNMETSMPSNIYHKYYRLHGKCDFFINHGIEYILPDEKYHFEIRKKKQKINEISSLLIRHSDVNNIVLDHGAHIFTKKIKITNEERNIINSIIYDLANEDLVINNKAHEQKKLIAIKKNREPIDNIIEDSLKKSEQERKIEENINEVEKIIRNKIYFIDNGGEIKKGKAETKDRIYHNFFTEIRSRRETVDLQTVTAPHTDLKYKKNLYMCNKNAEISKNISADVKNILSVARVKIKKAVDFYPDNEFKIIHGVSHFDLMVQGNKESFKYIYSKMHNNIKRNIHSNYPVHRTRFSAVISLYEMYVGNFITTAQLKLINKIVNALAENGKLKHYQLLMGAGKTSYIIPIVCIILNLFYKKTKIYVVQPVNLVEQSYMLFLKNVAPIFNISVSKDFSGNICILSDIDIKMRILDKKHEDVPIIFDEVDELSNNSKCELNLTKKKSLPVNFCEERIEFICDYITLMIEHCTSKGMVKIIDDQKIVSVDHDFNIAEYEKKSKRKDLIDFFKTHTYVYNKIEKIMKHILKSRKNLNYGIDTNNSCPRQNKYYAIPFVAANTPSQTSQFSDVDVCIAYTFLSYTYMDEIPLYIVNKFVRMPFDDRKLLWNFLRCTPTTLTDPDEIIEHARLEGSTPSFSDYDIRIHFIKNIFTSGEYKYNEVAENISFLDIFSSVYFKKRIGMTGTPFILPFIDVDESVCCVSFQKGANGMIIYNMINTFNFHKINIDDKLADVMKNILKDFNFMIDVAALYIRYDSRKLAMRFRELCNKNIIYFNEAGKAMKYDGYLHQPHDVGKITTANDFVFFSQSKITGVDMKLFYGNAKGIVTIKSNTRFRDVAQGIYRLREIGRGQSVEFMSYDDITVDAKQLVDLLLKNEERERKIMRNFFGPQQLHAYYRSTCGFEERSYETIINSDEMSIADVVKKTYENNKDPMIQKFLSECNSSDDIKIVVNDSMNENEAEVESEKINVNEVINTSTFRAYNDSIIVFVEGEAVATSPFDLFSYGPYGFFGEKKIIERNITSKDFFHHYPAYDSKIMMYREMNYNFQGHHKYSIPFGDNYCFSPKSIETLIECRCKKNFIASYSLYVYKIMGKTCVFNTTESINMVGINDKNKITTVENAHDEYLLRFYSLSPSQKKDDVKHIIDKIKTVIEADLPRIFETADKKKILIEDSMTYHTRELIKAGCEMSHPVAGIYRDVLKLIGGS